MLRGVIAVMPGYSGGKTNLEEEPPSYEEVCSGITGHAEVIKIDYDPMFIAARDLLTVFFGSHDPTTLNRQGDDAGAQYRSVIFYTTPEQRQAAKQIIQEINASSPEGRTIVTAVEPLDRFYPAESHHHDYYANNRARSYCQLVINPKLKKVQERFANLLAKQEKHE